MSRETSDKDEELSTAACAKSRAVPPVPVSSAASARAIPPVPVSSARAVPTTLDPSDPPPAGPLQSPAATADRAAEAAEVDAVLDAWARGPPTPPAMGELRREIKRARSTSGSKDSPTP